MKLYYAIVIYNKQCKDSITIKKLENKDNIIIADNSTIENNNEEYCINNNIKYIKMNQNEGLSKAYNSIIKELNKIKDNDDYIMWLDDDTNITEEYLNEVEKCIPKYDVIMPIIKCKNKIVSPLKKIGIKYIGINDKNYNNFENIYAINSCLTVRLNIYRKNLYNEKLFLDNIDLDFFKRVILKEKLKLKILDSDIEQNLFLLENTNIENFKKRYAMYLKDNYIFYNSKFDRVQLFIKILYCAIKYSIKYKKISLLSFIVINYYKIIIEQYKEKK